MNTHNAGLFAMSTLENMRKSGAAPAARRLAALRLTAGLALAASLAGCAAGPDFERPAPPAVGNYSPHATNEVVTSAPSIVDSAQRVVPGLQVETEWWRGFRSPRLDAFIAEALKQSPTLAAAEATLRQAQEYQKARAGSTQLPQAEIGATAQRQQFNPGALGQVSDPREFSLYNTGVTVGYSLDPAGGNRRAIEALSARADTKQFELQAARLTLAGNIATTAFARARIAAQLEISISQLDNLEEQRRIARERVRLGNASADEVLALDAQTEQMRAEIPALRQGLAETEHLLATLAGRAPGQGDVPDFALSEFTLPQELPLVVPSQLVRQRPDILAAEAMVHAANADYGVAVAQMYPQLNLSATLGSQALTTDALFGGPSIVWSIIGQITQTLFNPGLTHEKRAALAAFDGATANYKVVVLNGLRDVADVLVAVDSNAHALEAQVNAADAAQEALATMQRRYKLGAASYIQVLIAAQQAQRANLAVIAARSDRLANSVAFYVAMGGGGGPTSPEVVE